MKLLVAMFISLLLEQSVHAQLPELPSTTILSIEQLGKPLEAEYKPGVFGHGLWMRGDTLLSATFFGVACAIAYTVNDALTWTFLTKRQLQANITASAHSQSGRYIVLGYEDGALEYSEDGGRSFRSVSSPTLIRISTIAVSETGEVILGRDKGRVFSSRDQCTTWQVDTLPILLQGNEPGVISHIVYDQYDGITITYNELSSANEVTTKVAHSQSGEPWRVWEVPNARQTFRADPSHIYASTVQRLPGRNDVACFCQLYSINLQTGAVKLEFVEDTVISVSSIMSVCRPPNSNTIWASSYPHAYVFRDSKWFRDPRSFKDIGLGFTNVVFRDNNVAYAITMRGLNRIRFASIVSVDHYTAAEGEVTCGGLDMDVDPSYSVYDLLGNLHFANHSEGPATWQAPTPGMYMLIDNANKRRIRWRLAN